MRRVLAHVDYVTEPDGGSDPIGFLLDALAQPGALLLFGVGTILVLALLLAWARWRPLDEARSRFVDRAAGYHEYVPWMLRLSAGLVLIGSGLSRTLFMPTVDAAGPIGLVLTATGFLLLVGFAVRLAALAALATFVVGGLANPELVMMLDVAGALAAAAVIGPGRPSLDDLLRAAFPRGPGARAATENLASGHDDLLPLVVRVGLGGAFAASGIADKLLIHDQALAAVERYGLTSVVPVSPELWVAGAALVETALGLALILGVLTRFAAAVGFAVLTLALFALPDDPVIAHVGLFGLSSVLVVLGGGRWSVDRAVLARLGERFRRSSPRGTTSAGW
ncbi:MAG TPA: DoxX family protein [Candidatus Limnocylindria bacterium]|nr:DoxX family protein [Candidatus Limnocylindria bacterium]